MTRLRKVMLEELQRRNFSSETIREYIGAVERFARYFDKPPDQLGPDHIRQYQAHLLHERKLAVGTVVAQTAGLRFFFVRTLKRRFPVHATVRMRREVCHLRDFRCFRTAMGHRLAALVSRPSAGAAGYHRSRTGRDWCATRDRRSREHSVGIDSE